MTVVASQNRQSNLIVGGIATYGASGRFDLPTDFVIRGREVPPDGAGCLGLMRGFIDALRFAGGFHDFADEFGIWSIWAGGGGCV
jgi:hypothetical protein